MAADDDAGPLRNPDTSTTRGAGRSTRKSATTAPAPSSKGRSPCSPPRIVTASPGALPVGRGPQSPPDADRVDDHDRERRLDPISSTITAAV